MKRLFAVALGILTAIGGFVDIGDIVANAETGARFGMSLAWVVIVGVIGICLFAEMAGRVATVSGRATFDLVREHLGARAALVNLVASFFITFLTLAAEIGGVALAIELATSVNYLLWVPVVAVLVWLVIWRVKFDIMENAFGLAGLALVVAAVALWRLEPDWGGLLHGATHPTVLQGEGHPTWWFFGIALLGAAMTPCEVFFFSSGAVEEGWTRADLITNRLNVYIGFPLGGLLSLALMAGATLFLEPRGIQSGHLSQVALPTLLVLGKLGLAVLLVGFFAATCSCWTASSSTRTAGSPARSTTSSSSSQRAVARRRWPPSWPAQGRSAGGLAAAWAPGWSRSPTASATATTSAPPGFPSPSSSGSTAPWT
jgi:Mn2+/Fe2+ NRAMP family transporter